MALFKKMIKSSVPAETPAEHRPEPETAESKPTATPVAGVPMAEENIFVSVIIPVYNSMPYLTELLNSLETQTLDKQFYEVIAVDDGSTDFGGEILDVYANRNANFRVVHQENSGWAGKPRNVGMDQSRGQYVFFVDGDDTLGPDALRRMRDFALEHDSDIVAPKLVPLGGRAIRASLFAKTLIDTPLETILATLMPQKMIRKQLLLEHGIRFREEKVRLEDGMALVEAYCAAKRISIVADYDYYFIRTRDDGQNISSQPIDPQGYTQSLTHIANTVRTHTADDPAHARLLIAGLFKRKGLRFFLGERFLNYKEARQRAWIGAQQAFLLEFLPEKRDEVFNPTDVAKTNAIVRGDLEELKRLSTLDQTSGKKPQLVRVEEQALSFLLEFTSPTTGPVPAKAIINERGGDRRLEAPVQRSATGDSYTAELSFADLAVLAGAIGDIHAEYPHAETRRIAFPDGVVEGFHQGIRVYQTIKGSLSIDLKKAQIS